MFRDISTYWNDTTQGSIQDQFKKKKKIQLIELKKNDHLYVKKKKKLEIGSLPEISHTSKSR